MRTHKPSLCYFPNTETEALNHLRCSLVSDVLDVVLSRIEHDWDDYQDIVSHWIALGQPDLSELRKQKENLEDDQTLRLLDFSSWFFNCGFWDNAHKAFNFPNAKMSCEALPR